MDIWIETDRLYLRAVTAGDLQGMFELDSDPMVHRYLGGQPIKTLHQAQENINYILQQYADYGIGRLAIIEKNTDTFLGWGGLKMVTEEINGIKDFYDLGYRLIRKHWGKGYATESALAAIQHGFDTLKIPTLYAFAETMHSASRNVIEKCGFEHKAIIDYDSTPHDWFELQNKRLQ